MSRPDKPAGVPLNELPDDIRERLGLPPAAKHRQVTFTAEHERRHALKVLALIADLTQAQRGRVLRRAARINDV